MKIRGPFEKFVDSVITPIGNFVDVR